MYEKTSIDDFKLEDVLFTGILRKKSETEIYDKSGTCQHLAESNINETIEHQLQTAFHGVLHGQQGWAPL